MELRSIKYDVEKVINDFFMQFHRNSLLKQKYWYDLKKKQEKKIGLSSMSFQIENNCFSLPEAYFLISQPLDQFILQKELLV